MAKVNNNSLTEWANIIERMHKETEPQCIPEFMVSHITTGRCDVICKTHNKFLHNHFNEENGGWYMYCPESKKILIYDKNYKS